MVVMTPDGKIEIADYCQHPDCTNKTVIWCAGLAACGDHEPWLMERVMRLQDLLPTGTEAEWTCGHVGGAMCAECYRILAAKAHELAEDNLRLREEVESLKIIEFDQRRQLSE